ncbi:hypothetical protein [Devosia neptuniae]|uniref:hypothetical protein n=1 Tax=Devosia neptuniae TaxID=191302 RepID=UPI0022AFD841|nr:hypothetical protein [Devosia neptuniae]MCZ4346443.1 hypothetical protein [Devosia neptuniae]
MQDKLQRTDTIETVWPRLTHQRKYVATVRHRMEQCAKIHGNASVKIGITGSGQKPCYRIIYLKAGEEQVFGSYWDMHDPLEVGAAMTANWSDAAMTFDELDAFFKSQIGWKST